MQPCSREMLGMNINSLLNKSSQISTQELQQQQRNSHSQINQHQIQSSHFESPMSHDDFLEQMLSTLGSGPSSWAEQLNSNNKSPWDTSIPNNGLPHHHNSNNNDNNQPRDFSDETVPADYENVAFPCDESSNLASKFRDHQINGGSKSSAAAAASMFHQQLMMSRGIAGASEHGIISMPLSPNNNGDFDRSQNDVVDGSSFKSPSRGSNNPIQSIYNGFGGSLHGASQVSPTQTQHFHHPQGNSMQAQSYGAPGAMMSQPQPPATGSLSGATTPSQARPRVRARRGQATDPHSIAERLRRERIAERMKALQELVPNGNKTDKASMLDEIIDYVKFLQLQVKVLSMSRLGGAASVAPNLGADMSSKGGGDCIQTNENGGTSGSHGNNQTASSSNNDSMTVTEHQVAKLMEEDMGSAMQYLQGKGLCLMPISLATAISTSTCHARSPMISNTVMQSNGEGPSSPSISVLTVQSATLVNGGPNNSVKDAVSVSVSVSVSEL